MGRLLRRLAGPPGGVRYPAARRVRGPPLVVGPAGAGQARWCRRPARGRRGPGPRGRGRDRPGPLLPWRRRNLPAGPLLQDRSFPVPLPRPGRGHPGPGPGGLTGHARSRRSGSPVSAAGAGGGGRPHAGGGRPRGPYPRAGRGPAVCLGRHGSGGRARGRAAGRCRAIPVPGRHGRRELVSGRVRR